MNSAGLITLLAVWSSSPPPTNPQFTEMTFTCKEIKYTYQIDNYPYVGINIGEDKNYLTNIKDYDILDSKIKKDCK